MSFVLDNSVAMRWLMPSGSDQDVSYAAGVVRYLQGGSSCNAPSLWPLEVANVVARSERMTMATRKECTDFLHLVRTLDVILDEQTSARAWTNILDLAREYRLSAYDAAYLELAIRKALPLASLDKDLLKAAKKTGVSRFEP